MAVTRLCWAVTPGCPDHCCLASIGKSSAMSGASLLGIPVLHLVVMCNGWWCKCSARFLFKEQRIKTASLLGIPVLHLQGGGGGGGSHVIDRGPVTSPLVPCICSCPHAAKCKAAGWFGPWNPMNGQRNSIPKASSSTRGRPSLPSVEFTVGSHTLIMSSYSPKYNEPTRETRWPLVQLPPWMVDSSPPLGASETAASPGRGTRPRMPGRGRGSLAQNASYGRSTCLALATGEPTECKERENALAVC